MPSIDRKDHRFPHHMGNLLISTWGVNSMRGKCVSIDDTKEFVSNIINNFKG